MSCWVEHNEQLIRVAVVRLVRRHHPAELDQPVPVFLFHGSRCRSRPTGDWPP